jgi:hypothetical protein
MIPANRGVLVVQTSIMPGKKRSAPSPSSSSSSSSTSSGEGGVSNKIRKISDAREVKRRAAADDSNSLSHEVNEFYNDVQEFKDAEGIVRFSTGTEGKALGEFMSERFPGHTFRVYADGMHGAYLYVCVRGCVCVSASWVYADAMHGCINVCV